MPFRAANHLQRVSVSTSFPLSFSFTLGASLAVSGLALYYGIIFNRGAAAWFRRKTQASEMKEVLKARLDRFHAKLDGGEVVGLEELHEGERMEGLFRRWVRALEDAAAADDEGRSAAVKAERWPGWF